MLRSHLDVGVPVALGQVKLPRVERSLTSYGREARTGACALLALPREDVRRSALRAVHKAAPWRGHDRWECPELAVVEADGEPGWVFLTGDTAAIHYALRAMKYAAARALLTEAQLRVMVAVADATLGPGAIDDPVGWFDDLRGDVEAGFDALREDVAGNARQTVERMRALAHRERR